jgi:hypothetical protein
MKKAISTITLLVTFGLNNPANAQTLPGGRAFSLAVCDNNTVKAWGDNANGALGNGTNTNSNVPVQVNMLCPVLSLNEPAGQPSLSILTSRGQQLPEQKITGPTTTIDVSTLPGGIYFVSLSGVTIITLSGS